MATVKIKKRPQGVSIRMTHVRNKVIRSMDSILNKHIVMRNRFTATWTKKNKPKYVKVYGYKNRTLSIKLKSIAPEARQASISVYEMITKKRHGNLATKVRYMQVSPDFISKTQPRVIDSGSGGGS